MRSRRPVPIQGNAGFTLIETLVAISLVSAISAGMVIALRTGILTMERTQARLDQNRRAVGIASLVRKQIAAAMPVNGLCQTGGEPTLAPVFQGSPTMFVMVSSYSMTEGSRGYPHVVQYQIVRGPDGLRVVANEYLYSSPASTLPFCHVAGPGILPPMPVTPQSFIVADHLAAARFVYLQGYAGSIRVTGWIDQWLPQGLPSAVHIDMTPLPSQGAGVDLLRLAAASITVPLHITKVPRERYEDAPNN